MSPKENEGPIILTRLEVRNFKKIRAGVWDLEPGLNRLTSDGKNKQGKTSVLHAIRTLFEGAGAVPPEPRNSEAESDDEAFVRGCLSNGWTIKRTFTEKGTYLHVEGPNGLQGKQGHISPWLGNGHFNPLGFFKLSAEEQARALLSLSSVEDLEGRLTELEAEEKAVYEERTPYISEKRRLRAVPKPEGERPTPISVNEEMEQLGRLQKEQREWQDERRELNALESQFNGLERRADETRAEIADLEARLEKARDRLTKTGEDMAEVSDAIEAQKEKLSEEPDVQSQIEEVQARIEKAEEVQDALEPWKEWERAQEQLEDVEARVEDLTEAIEDTRRARKELISEADFPVDGLSFTAEGEVLLNGHPLEQASGRERIELGVTAALAHDPELRIVLVDEGDAVDSEGIENLREVCREHGLQVVLARLGLEGAGELEVVDGWGPVPEEGAVEAEEVVA